MGGVAIHVIGHRRPHDGAALGHREQRIDGHGALRIERLLHRAGRGVLTNRRNEY